MKLGEKIIPFSLIGVDGKIYTEKSFPENELLAVVFWCNHCPYVQAWESRMIRIGKEYKGKLSIVLINSNDPTKYPEDSFENMKRRAEEKGYPFPYLFDETQEIARKYGATRTPEIFLFDKERILRYHGAPDDNYQDENKVQKKYFVMAIESLLNNRNIEIPDTQPVGCTIKWK